MAYQSTLRLKEKNYKGINNDNLGAWQCLSMLDVKWSTWLNEALLIKIFFDETLSVIFDT